MIQKGVDGVKEGVMKEIVRRSLVLCGLGATGAALLGQDKEEEEVSPAEDLMREHGVLKRVLFVYDDAAGRLENRKDLPADVIPAAAQLIRQFIEEYHEKLEEVHLFPRFRKAGKLVDLVDVLERQHKAGRRVTERILQLARGGAPKDEDGRRGLASQLRAFVRMYGPHEAREDTVLFPALRTIVSAHEYDSLGEDFEKKEHQLFGEGGFESKVVVVAGIEKKLGIYDLAQFTPRV